ncbi:porin [Vibrio sp. TBV020]|uniref:porin n=1 Tax=Vibrio sp. TBV020 TaxID=3137398 RepID=UPI0038CD109A
MKKTLVALSVLAASASATAGFEIYNQDGVTVQMGGDIEVVYVKDTAKNSDFAQDIQDADLDFDVRYAVSDSTQVGAFWQFTDVGTSEGDAYVAVYNDSLGSLKVGRLCTALDDAGIGSDYQFGLTTFFEDSEVYCQDEIARYDYDNGSFYGTLAIAQDYNNDIALKNSDTYVDGAIGYRVADFDFTGFYGNGTIIESGVEADETLWSVQARYNGVENLGLAIAYYDFTKDITNVSKDFEANTIALAATYTLDKVTFAAGYAMSDDNVDATKDQDDWYVNAGYGIAPNTTLYAEVGGTNEDNTDTGYAVGVKAFF